jgi:GT2 family glycosyltransferase
MDPSRTEILIQDDASPDCVLSELMHFPPVKVERNEQNMGFAHTVNRAAARAKGDYILILNQDTQATALGWADVMLRMFGNPAIGIVGPKLIFPPTPELPEGAIQSCGGLFDAGKGPYHRYLGWRNIYDWRVNKTEKVSWVTGAAIMIKREDFYQVGGLDAETFVGGYFEDTDLCMKVRFDLHKEVWYCPEAMLIHDVGSTGGNPANFQNNSRKFHERWNDKIMPDVSTVYVNY